MGSVASIGLAIGLGALLASPARAGGPQNHVFRVGVAYRAFRLDKPYDWRGAKTHALLTTIWYPAVASAVEKPQWIGSPPHAFASAGMAAEGAQPGAAPARLPLVMLSHGTGGSALQMAWLGTV